MRNPTDAALDRMIREHGSDPATMDWRDLALARATMAAILERRDVLNQVRG